MIVLKHHVVLQGKVTWCFNTIINVVCIVFLKIGLVFYLNPLSKISDAVNSNSFPHIITAMLEGKNLSLLKNIEELKVKAILEYREGIYYHYYLIFFCAFYFALASDCT